MPEEQQQAAAPAANDTKTSWSFGDFAKGLGSPLTKNEDGSYNVAGALLTGAGSGLVTWVLSRMLGIKSGPSLGISILAALAGTHGAFTKQGGLDFFSNPKGYLKDFMDQKRVDNGVPPPEEKTKQERFQEKLREQNQIDALNKLTANKSPEQLTQLQESLGANGGSLDNSVLSQLSDDEKAAVMSGEAVNPAIIQKVEDARNRALEIRSLGRELKDVPEEDWLDPNKNLIYNVMLNEFNAFRGNSKVRGQNGTIDLNKALVEMENSGNPLAVESVRRYRQALQNHTNQLINNKADAVMRREIEEANDRRRYPEKYVYPVATQGYGPEYREMFQPPNILPNRGPSGFDWQNLSSHTGEPNFSSPRPRALNTNIGKQVNTPLQPSAISKELPIGGNVTMNPADQAWADVQKRSGYKVVTPWNNQ